MGLTFDECVAVALAPGAVRVRTRGTEPPTFGVYRVPDGAACARRYRFGRHPERAVALARAFGGYELVHLFLGREQAETVARHLNALPPPRERDDVRAHPASEQAQAMALYGDGDDDAARDEASRALPVATLGKDAWAPPTQATRRD